MYEYVQLCDDTTNKTASLEELFELLIAWKTICGSNRKGTVQSEHAGALQWHQSKVTMVPSTVYSGADQSVAPRVLGMWFDDSKIFQGPTLQDLGRD